MKQEQECLDKTPNDDDARTQLRHACVSLFLLETPIIPAAFTVCVFLFILSAIPALLLGRTDDPSLLYAVGAGSLYLIIFVPRWQLARASRRHDLDFPKNLQLRNEARKTVIEVLGGLAVLIGLYIAWADLKKTGERFEAQFGALQEVQAAERFSRAANLLGQTGHYARIAGIHELDQLGSIGPDHRTRAIEVLAAYIRKTRAFTDDDLQSEQENDGKVRDGVLETRSALLVLGKHNLSKDLKIDLRNADLGGELLRNIEVRLANAILDGCNLADGFLHEADLAAASCKETRFLKADMRRAKLAGSRLDDSSLKEANLYEATLTKAWLPRATLTKATLAKADLERAMLFWADLRECDLTEANLVGANLRFAKLADANLTRARLMSANLKNCPDWRKIRSLTGAFVNENTVPREFVEWAIQEKGAIRVQTGH